MPETDNLSILVEAALHPHYFFKFKEWKLLHLKCEMIVGRETTIAQIEKISAMTQEDFFPESTLLSISVTKAPIIFLNFLLSTVFKVSISIVIFMII